MADIGEMRKALVKRIREGAGEASAADRQAAFDDSGLSGARGVLADKVARQPYRVTDEDIRNAIASGMSEDQVFELVVCAAVGQANRQYEAAMAALEAASGRSER